MTEGPPYQHEKPMCIRLWLELGHMCEPRCSASGRALALDWRVWVRGVRGDISAVVHKVVFKLNPPSAFVYPRRVIREPPYEIQESGSSSIDIPIYVYLKFPNRPKKIRLRYSLKINNNKASAESKRIYYDFANPSEALRSALMKSGGETICGTGSEDKLGEVVVVLSEHRSSERKATKKKRRNTFIEPVRDKHQTKTLSKSSILGEICSKCSLLINSDIRKQLRTVAMTEDEINNVSQLYTLYSGYERSETALVLPPFSDPIYSLPQLPASLRSIEADYAMQ